MKIKLKISLFWKLLLLCGGLIFIAAITQHILLRFLMSSDAMRKLYLQEWQLTTMQQQFRDNYQQLETDTLTNAAPILVKNSFQNYVNDDGYLIKEGKDPYLLLHIDNLAVVNLNGDLIGQLGQKRFEEGNLFTQLSLDAREDLVEALIGKDFFGSSRPKGYAGVTAAISLIDTQGVIVGAIIVDQRRQLTDNFTGLAFGFIQVAKGISRFVMNLFFACIFFALVMSLYLNRRLKKITQGVKQWQQGNFAERIQDEASDELAACSNELNHLADSLQRALIKEAEIASIDERQQLAIELHDTVKQRLFATSLKVALCEKVMSKEPDQAKELLAEIAEQCQQSFVELQNTIEALRLNESKLWPELKDFISKWQKQHDIKVLFTELENWQPEQKLAKLLWRVITEALQNIVKHANASLVIIDIGQSNELLKISVKDDGIGCDEKVILGQGLSLLSTSIYSMGGTFQLLQNTTGNNESNENNESYAGTELLVELSISKLSTVNVDNVEQLNDH